MIIDEMNVCVNDDPPPPSTKIFLVYLLLVLQESIVRSITVTIGKGTISQQVPRSLLSLVKSRSLQMTRVEYDVYKLELST